MKTINRKQLQQKLEGNGVALVEVLAPDAYQNFHLPHAINVPLGESFERDIQQAVPNKSQAVVVYCQSDQCDASPKAAKQLEQIGYTNVFDYEAGKTDWKAAGLPVEA